MSNIQYTHKTYKTSLIANTCENCSKKPCICQELLKQKLFKQKEIEKQQKIQKQKELKEVLKVVSFASLNNKINKTQEKKEEFYEDDNIDIDEYLDEEDDLEEEY